MTIIKKSYITPQAHELSISTYAPIATSINIHIGEDKENGCTDAGKHKGSWGNLWR